MSDLSLVELESELSAVLPTRNLMRRRRGAHASAHASFGSAANANATYQINFNPQIVVNNGNLNDAGIKISSFNANSNSNLQTGTPLNFGVGL